MTDKKKFAGVENKVTVDPENSGRRKAVKTIVSGVVAVAACHVMPTNWSKPLIEQVFLPAHAQTSQADPPPSEPDPPPSEPDPPSSEPDPPSCTDNDLACSIDGFSYALVGSDYIWDIIVTLTATSHCNADFTGAEVAVVGSMDIYGEITPISEVVVLDGAGNFTGLLNVNSGPQNPGGGFVLYLTFTFQNPLLFGTGTTNCGINAAA